MGTPISGTNLVAPVVPFNTDDIYPTHFSLYGAGGYREVADITTRDAIPALRRIQGMLVYTASTGLVYQLQSDLVTWEIFGGSGGSADRITQVAHGLAVGQAIRFGTSWVLAQADTPADAFALGIVSLVQSADEFTVVYSGAISGLTQTLIPGTLYYLDPSTAGRLTATVPVTPGQVIKPILFATGVHSGVVLQYPGVVISGGQGVTLPASATVLDTLDATKYRAARWALELDRGADHLTIEIIGNHDGTTASDMRPASLESGTGIVDVAMGAVLSGGNLQLVVTPATTGWKATWQRLYAIAL